VSAEFAIGEMTRFETAEDGSSIRLDMEDVSGRLVSLHIPFQCLNQLIMTLPAMVRRALQQQRGDPSLRIVYPASRFQVELAGDFETRILTLETPDGFSVSFGLTGEQFREIGADRRCEETRKRHPGRRSGLRRRLLQVERFRDAPLVRCLSEAAGVWAKVWAASRPSRLRRPYVLGLS
jgi:hypothetical protein